MASVPLPLPLLSWPRPSNSVLEHIEDDLVYIETRLVNKQIESDDETGSSSDEDSDYFDFEDGLIAKIEDVERHNDDEVFEIPYF